NGDFSESVENEAIPDKLKDVCPNCGSGDLSVHTKGKKPAFLVFILLGFPLFFYKHGYKCNQCGEFSEKL
ncbi:hypothetical protein ABEQ50_12470, partial [Cutibacterium acnes]